MKLPIRKGERPETGKQTPHLQLSDKSPREIYDAMADWAFLQTPKKIDKVQEQPTGISVPSSRALWLDESIEIRSGGFMPPQGSREFAHLHADGSWHLVVDESLIEHIIEQGWGELHPLYDQGVLEILIYAPRDKGELGVIKTLVNASIDYATQDQRASVNV